MMAAHSASFDLVACLEGGQVQCWKALRMLLEELHLARLLMALCGLSFVILHGDLPDGGQVMALWGQLFVILTQGFDVRI